MSAILRFKDVDGNWIDTPSLVGRKGVSIEAITKVGTVGLTDTYRVDFSDGTNTLFTINNGEKGDKGDKGDKGEIDIVTATTLNQDDEATVTKTVDEDGKVTLNFGIPRGNTTVTFIDWGDEE